MSKEKKTNNVMDIINAISSAMQNSYDGAVDDKGEPVKIGLNREVDNVVLDSRSGIMDGFCIRFGSDKLIVSYHGEVSMKDLHRDGPKKFERDIEDKFADIAKFLKKEYKKHAKGALKLVSQGDCEAKIQRLSNIRNWVTASKVYKIGNTNEPVGDQSGNTGPRTVDKAVADFLALSTDKRPKNAKIKND